MTVREHKAQRAGLTRAANKYAKARGGPGEVAARRALVAECRRAVEEWESQEWADRYRVRRGAWPDDWATWQRAIDDAWPGWGGGPDLRDLPRL